MLGLDELEFKYMKNCKHVENYEGYSYSVYKLSGGPYSDINMLRSKGVIKLGNEDIFYLYKHNPLDTDKINDVLLNYSLTRPCIISALVCVDGKHYEQKNVRYLVSPHPKYLQINMYDNIYNKDTYLLELAVRDVIDYLKELEEVNKNEGK